jgi:hypothetical protein
VAWLFKSNINSSLLKQCAPSSGRNFWNTANCTRECLTSHQTSTVFGCCRLQNLQNHYLRRQNGSACTEYEARNNTPCGVDRRKRKAVWTILNNKERSVNAIHTKPKQPKVVTFFHRCISLKFTFRFRFVIVANRTNKTRRATTAISMARYGSFPGMLQSGLFLLLYGYLRDSTNLDYKVLGSYKTLP